MGLKSYCYLSIVIPFLIQCGQVLDQRRVVWSLNNDWVSIAGDSINQFAGFEQEGFNAESWVKVNVPHNWDKYEGYRRLKHGNRHGIAWYRKHVSLDQFSEGRRYFLFFEGVGSYATVYLNGQQVGHHAGGRTTFTIDVTDAIHEGDDNLLAVRADHPAFIQDLPWVCGGCSDEYGFCEGSQPMGIFRPIHLVETSSIRIQPFGIHVWNDERVREDSARIHITSEIKNYSSQARQIEVVNRLVDHLGEEVTSKTTSITIEAGETQNLRQDSEPFGNVRLWSTQDPYLYDLVTEVYEDGVSVDKEVTPYGIRWIKWDIAENGSNRFFLNGKPVFLNGTAEYEHNMGNSHAFSDEMVQARVSQIVAAGFNAFRDAHQPHNFRYHQEWDRQGVLWWTQMSAHIWYDTPEFRKNFKALMKDWIKERRNSPSIILWGLENESTLPTEFAKECTQIIRELDPTSPNQRLVTTCNGGTGTDWNVPQNWTGTYGGNPDTYDEDLKRQVLVGEYGAWRTLDLHTEGPFDQKGAYSEDRITQLMEKKVRLGEMAADSSSGHFQWIFTSHENPGRNQSGEAYRELDRVGPVNYKGLLSAWGEPADVFYMFRANHAPKDKEPMVYLVSHTWPNRWAGPGMKDSLVVYSNCEEVELFNGDRSLGKQKHPGLGRHFQWDHVEISESLVTAVGYVNGKEVAMDRVEFHHLPLSQEVTEEQEALIPNKDVNYLYRVNCGGPDYEDANGNLWMADVHLGSDDAWGSTSWTDAFDKMPPYYASQRRTFDPILNTTDDPLFQSFRFGQEQLKFHFPVEPGTYEVELHFVEPWYGTGGGLDCVNWRNFDVAINGQVVIDDLDIWSEVGHDHALIKKVRVKVTGDKLVVHFPEVKSGQAIISAIAIAAENKDLKPQATSRKTLQVKRGGKVSTWLDWGQKPFDRSELAFRNLPPELFGADWIKTEDGSGMVELGFAREADMYVALKRGLDLPNWVYEFDRTKSVVQLAGDGTIEYDVYKKRFPMTSSLELGATGQEYGAIILAQPAAELEPPYDLKPKVPYDEDVVILKAGQLTIEEKNNLPAVIVGSNARSIIEWPIATGVADYHAIHFKFANESEEEIKATFNLIAADGSLMQSTELVFHPTPPTKYREISTTTESMINAGKYKVQVVVENGQGLALRGIRVQ
ncbi:malectin domain-containing carbohydrate-binding protein [Marinoscillum sp. MHG1-6]|uniref:malectin domain-containing carbohydrate-binding protein n=1 Tax=Marinoscillum sp. MHG1-6 TaxID=2959627 RepID=UPI0021584E05|nr:malectin domain-containing carbohydrate-binding protein [Marinoscillum sp. MHG1-6]